MEGIKFETRVRMAAKMTSKGQVQMDVTAEAPNVKIATELLSEALDELKRTVMAKGYELAGS